MQIATGMYLGDGAAGRTIVTGLSGEIRGVVMVNDLGGGATTGDLDVWIDRLSALLPGNVYWDSAAGLGQGLSASGGNFVVDGTTSTPTNEAPRNYFWIAFSE